MYLKVLFYFYFLVGSELALICWRQRIILLWLLDLNILLSVFFRAGIVSSGLEPIWNILMSPTYDEVW
jgi:uncharacterized protein with ParB-like and HNH nuclease domain